MKKKQSQPWKKPMPEKQFAWMRDILAAPSPIGLEAAMTHGVLRPAFESFMPKGWGIHTFKGNAGIVLDTHPGEDHRTSIMFIGHADKIRMQVRSIGDDGKVWVNTDSFLPCTLIGHEVVIYSRNEKREGAYRAIEGGTVEAIGAIHFAPSDMRTGAKGLRSEQIYLELQVHGNNKREQVLGRGIREGDAVLLKRPIRRGFSPDTFYGAYLDNGLGCFVVAEAARLLAAAGGTNHLRVLFAIATYEEIGRFGSRVLAGLFKPDILVGVDVDHDYKAAPGVGDQRYPQNEIGAGFTIANGSITSENLNQRLYDVCHRWDIPFQRSPTGRDTGTDAMAGVLGNIDAAATSVGIPVRNMHTISESAHTGDVLACLHALDHLIHALDKRDDAKAGLRQHLTKGHPRLDRAD